MRIAELFREFCVELQTWLTTQERCRVTPKLRFSHQVSLAENFERWCARRCIGARAAQVLREYQAELTMKILVNRSALLGGAAWASPKLCRETYKSAVLGEWLTFITDQRSVVYLDFCKAMFNLYRGDVARTPGHLEEFRYGIGQERLRKTCALCLNADEYADGLGEFQIDLFKKEGLSSTAPFNHDFNGYLYEMSTTTFHLNPKRLLWLKRFAMPYTGQLSYESLR